MSDTRLDLTHYWAWRPTVNWALDRCDVCGEQAAGELRGDFEGAPVVLSGEFLPRQLVVTCTAYSCTAHLSEAVALVEQRGAQSVGNARRPAEYPEVTISSRPSGLWDYTCSECRETLIVAPSREDARFEARRHLMVAHHASGEIANSLIHDGEPHA